MSAKRRRRFRKLKKIFKPTVGKLLGILMAAYFVFTFMSYKDRVQVSYYEVEEGSLVKEHNYTGLILREEEIVPSGGNGYIYFYVADGKKAAKGSPVYTIDEGGRLMEYLDTHSNELSNLNSSKINDIRAEMLHYSRTFDPRDFRSLYNIKNTLDAHTIEYASMNIFSSISTDLISAGINFREFDTDTTGIVCCYTDGYEDVSEGDINLTLFNTDNYDKVNIKAGDLISVGNPAYKMITDENWTIVFPMNEEDIAEFGSSDMLKLNFSDKGFTVKAKFKTITGSDSRQYGVLSLDSYIVQFTADRFVDFEVVTNDVSGLKIPEKSVTHKDFYIIPVDYMSLDAKDNKGFYKAVVGDSGTAAQFVIPDIFNIDDEYCYINCDDNSPLKAGDYVMLSPEYAVTFTEQSYQSETASKPEASSAEDTSEESESADGTAVSDEADAEHDAAESTNSDSESQSESESQNESPEALSAANISPTDKLYRIEAKKGLEGVFNVNKGYTVFKKVEPLETANGYIIVKKNSSYGLQVYDHIVLDASTVHDGQILYR